MKYTVKRTGRTFGVFETASDILVEGGFFRREAAEECCDRWNKGENS